MGTAVLPWAVHIADGVLSPFWLAVGWAGALALALLGSIQIVLGGMAAGRRGSAEPPAHMADEVARVALLTAAFFVASSIHLRLGPTSVHLLLGGLVGVLLRGRAGLAILVGVTLQALLIPHGGVLSIGVNTCTEAVPALLAGGLFALLQRVKWHRHPMVRFALVSLAAFTWAASLVFAVMVLVTNPLGELVTLRDQAGLILSAADLRPAQAVLRHPLTLVCLLLFSSACGWLEWRMKNPPEFALGMLAGGLAVLLTISLTGGVLLADGADRWRSFVNLVFLAHLPLVILEGLVVGTVVGFLARVKPAMLGLEDPYCEEEMEATIPSGLEGTAPATSPATIKPPLMLLILGALLLGPSPAWAHSLEAKYRVDREQHRIHVESWYETGDSPRSAKVRVYRADSSLILEGALDESGKFSFPYEVPEALRIVVSAPGGHRAQMKVPAEKLGGQAPTRTETRPTTTPSETSGGKTLPAERSRSRNLLTGIGLLLGVVGLALGVRWLVKRRGEDQSAHQ